MIWARVEDYNRGRDPERLALKYKRMAASALGFFRGTAHLFYEDWPGDSELLRAAPLAWVCGDLHVENFGTYRADNRLVYFDCNDFDEACVGPATWDIARLLVSVAIECMEREEKQAPLMKRVVRAYATELQTGKPRWTEAETSTGIIRELFDGLQHRTAQKFLASRTVLQGRRRVIDTGKGRALAAAPADLEMVQAFFAKKTAFTCVDVARRVAGNGSLGVPRFVALVEDKAKNPFLLDLKQGQPAAALRFHPSALAPAFRDDAERVVGGAGLFLAMPPAFLQPVRFGGTGWVLRELLPNEDRVDVAGASLPAFKEYAETLGTVTAWGHLRGSGRKGAANGDALVEWDVPEKRLLEFGRDYARQVKRDWQEFRERAAVS